VDPRKVIFGTTTNIHSTGILVVVHEKEYLTLISRPFLRNRETPQQPSSMLPQLAEQYSSQDLLHVVWSEY
jgi:hypothetical protein